MTRGNVKILNQKLAFQSNASSKVGSLDNAKHVAKGGNVKILNEKLDFKSKASSKVGSTELLHHQPGGGNMID